MRRIKASEVAVGIAADMAPATAFNTSPAIRVGFRPSLSDISPTTHPPMSIPVRKKEGTEGRERRGRKEGKGGERREKEGGK